jgi:hypothetical protein
MERQVQPEVTHIINKYTPRFGAATFHARALSFELDSEATHFTLFSECIANVHYARATAGRHLLLIYLHLCYSSAIKQLHRLSGSPVEMWPVAGRQPTAFVPQ